MHTLYRVCLFVWYKGRTINDLGGGGQAKAGKQNSTATRLGKKTHQLVGQEKKLNTNSMPEPPPLDH